MSRMLRIAVFALVSSVLIVGDASAAKKPKTDTPPAGYSKVVSVDQDKKTFTVFGDDTNYKFTDTTTNKDRIEVGAYVKYTLKDGSKADVTSVDVAPATPAQKKKKNNNNT